MKGLYIKMKHGGGHPTTDLLAKEFGINNEYRYDPLQYLRPYSTFLYAPIASKKIRDYDIYFLESLSPSSLLRFIKNKRNLTVVKENSLSAYFIENRLTWKFVYKYLLDLDNSLDYMIAVSNMVKEDFEKNFRFKIITCEGFTWRDYNELKKINPNFKSKNFIHIGNNGFIKGVDIMIETFINLKKRNIIDKDTKFYIIGKNSDFIKSKGFKKEDLSIYNIIIVERSGFVQKTDSLKHYLSDSLFQFHFARYDPNPGAVMEGMASGHIPIISYKTGTRDFVSKIDKNLVINSFDEEEIGDKVEIIINYSDEELRKLSQKFKEESHIYSKEEGLKRWKDVWEKITK